MGKINCGLHKHWKWFSLLEKWQWYIIQWEKQADFKMQILMTPCILNCVLIQKKYLEEFFLKGSLWFILGGKILEYIHILL